MSRLGLDLCGCIYAKPSKEYYMLEKEWWFECVKHGEKTDSSACQKCKDKRDVATQDCVNKSGVMEKIRCKECVYIQGRADNRYFSCVLDEENPRTVCEGTYACLEFVRKTL